TRSFFAQNKKQSSQVQVETLLHSWGEGLADPSKYTAHSKELNIPSHYIAYIVNIVRDTIFGTLARISPKDTISLAAEKDYDSASETSLDLEFPLHTLYQSDPGQPSTTAVPPKPPVDHDSHSDHVPSSQTSQDQTMS